MDPLGVALVFPGQGAQYVGMGMALAQRFPVAQAVLAESDRVLGFPLSETIARGPEQDLRRTDVSQPAILTASWMAHEVLREQRGPPAIEATAGLSLGEYTALVAAGALEFADALRLVRLRGQLMQSAADRTPGGMVALVGADEAKARILCDAVRDGDVLQVASLNAVGQVVVSGSLAACGRAVAAARDHGIGQAMPLNVAGAFHSALMQPAADGLRSALAKVPMRDPAVPVYANVSARPVTRAGDIASLLVQQLTAPVRWSDSLLGMRNHGIDRFWELGPGKTLRGLIQRTVQDVRVMNLEKPEDLGQFSVAAP